MCWVCCSSWPRSGFARRNRFGGAAVAVALAAGVKPIAAVLAPLIALVSHRRLRFAAIFLAAAATTYVPIFAYRSGYVGPLGTATKMSQSWEANGSVYELIKHVFGTHDPGGVAMEHAKRAARILAMVAPVILVVCLCVKRTPVEMAAYWIWLTMALLSPVVYPWYLLWIISLVPLLLPGRGDQRTDLVDDGWIELPAVAQRLASVRPSSAGRVRARLRGGGSRNNRIDGQVVQRTTLNIRSSTLNAERCAVSTDRCIRDRHPAFAG